MEKLLKGRGDPKKGACYQCGYFFQLGCGKYNYCNSYLHLCDSAPISIECRCQSLFSLYSFSSCFHGVYFLFASCRCFLFQGSECVFFLFLKCVLSQELMSECTYTVLTYGQSIMFLYDGTWCQFYHEVSCTQWQQLC